MFTIYGAILQHSGAGKFFIDFSLAVVGGKPSSAGHAVLASSFLLGGPSGSGVATTVMIGTVAWPMLKKAGFSRTLLVGCWPRVDLEPLFRRRCWRRRLPDRRVSQDQLSDVIWMATNSNLSLLPVAVVHG